MPAVMLGMFALYQPETKPNGGSMCGIVHQPTRKKSFPWKYARLHPDLVDKILDVCEETHIPERAAHILLSLADYSLRQENLIRVALPFAVYGNGRRYVTRETIAAEEDVIHLAMAGSARHHINEALHPHGIKLEMGHCCTIEMHAIAHEAEAMGLSHDANVYRADMLRHLNEEVRVEPDEFLLMISDQPLRLLAESLFFNRETIS